MSRIGGQTQAVADVFWILGSPVRVRLLSLLRAAPDDEACVTELVDSLGMSPSTVSHHLRVLAQRGFVCSVRRGSHVWYAARPGRLDAIDLVLL